MEIASQTMRPAESSDVMTTVGKKYTNVPLIPSFLVALAGGSITIALAYLLKGVLPYFHSLIMERGPVQFLTVYGGGTQKRSFLPLADSMQCLKIVIDNPPPLGEYRLINQFHEIYSIRELAKIVREKTGVDFIQIKNPRNEKERHPYDIERTWLDNHGYNPSTTIGSEIDIVLGILKDHKINTDGFIPKIKWN